MKEDWRDYLKIHLVGPFGMKPIVESATDTFRVFTDTGDDYVAKLYPAHREPTRLAEEANLLTYLQGQPLPFATPTLVADERLPDGRTLRLLTYLPGRPLRSIMPVTADLRHRWGVLTAQLHDALKSYSGTQLAADASQNIEQFLEFQTQANYSTPAQHKLAEYFRGRFATDTLPHLSTLPGANSCHHDHGRHLLVDGAGQITGVVGFGKVARTTHLYGIATACAYAGMNVPAPLDAMAEVIRGYMTVQPITHVEHLYNLIAVRLLAIAGTTTPAHPDCLLTTSATAAWALLARLKTIHPTLALAVFADAAAADLPLPVAHSYRSHQPEIVHPPVALQGRTLHRLDLSAGSTELGAATNYRDVRRFSQHIRRTLQRAGADYGYGGRAETRPVYTSEAFTETGNDGSRWRTVHLGIDIWGAAGTPVYAPISGRVHSVAIDPRPLTYGPTLILQHDLPGGHHFYTLYGHLAAREIDRYQSRIERGETIAFRGGEIIAYFGDESVNGGWPPHLHFQVILDMLGLKGDFPGVAFPEQASAYLSICPDPTPFFAPYLPDTIARSPGSAVLDTHGHHRPGQLRGKPYA